MATRKSASISTPPLAIMVVWCLQELGIQWKYWSHLSFMRQRMANMVRMVARRWNNHHLKTAPTALQAHWVFAASYRKKG